MYSYGHKKRYFYLEEHYLKYGKFEGKPIKRVFDLSEGVSEVIPSPKYKTQFKVLVQVGGRKLKLKLKADTDADRDKWISAIRQAIEKYGGQAPWNYVQPANLSPAELIA